MAKIKAVALISGGIDSPVACYLMKKKGMEIIYLHLKTKNSDSIKVRRLIDSFDRGAKMAVIDLVPTLTKIAEQANRRFTCVLCKRAMYREAEKFAKSEDATFIITGENLGQVASQTLENMAVLDNAVTIPVLRPLLCFDKKDITKIAETIGTINVSIEGNNKCAFVPDSPVTRAKLSLVLKLEENLKNS
jgi:thiamine biosynthesis protein ThiI